MFLAATLLIGLVAQLVDGSLGMGFGVFSMSFLVMAGAYPALASSVVHSAKVVTTLFSGGAHFWLGNVKKEWLLPLVVPGVFGGVAGALAVTALPGQAMRPWVAGILLALGLLIFFRYLRPRRQAGVLPPNGDHVGHPLRTRGRLGLVAVGGVAAFVDAIGGGGWGPIATPGLVLGHNSDPVKAIGTVNLAEFFVAVAITVTLLLRIGWTSVPWGPTIGLMIGGAVAAPGAAYLCRRLPGRLLGMAVGGLLIASNVGTVLSTWG